jgi:UDP-N-acetylmuramate: L-alanyl-gamma-D-glutamyl-meso-diaminopimelate ligase
VSADVSILAPVGRSEIPEDEKLDIAGIAEAITRNGRRARACETVGEAIDAAAAEAKPGDTIVVMSNGRFDDAPDRILLALVERGR